MAIVETDSSALTVRCMEKLIALIVVTVVGVGGSVAGFQQIQDAAHREQARTNLTRIMSLAQQLGQTEAIRGGDTTPENALRLAFEASRGGENTMTVNGTRVTSVVGDYCYEAVLEDIDLPVNVFECNSTSPKAE